jgi:hypothetical protein
MPLLRLLLAAFLLGTPLVAAAETPSVAAAAAADPTALAAVVAAAQKIIDEGDPADAKAWLDDAEQQTELKESDGGLFHKTFRRATEITDLKQVLTDFKTIDGIRGGLRERGDYEFLKNPPLLFAWAEKHIPGIDLSVLRRSVYEWEVLTEGQKHYIHDKNHVPERNWRTAPFSHRVYMLSNYAKELSDALMTENPKTDSQLLALRARAIELWPMLSQEQKHILGRRVQQWQQSVSNLGTLTEMLKDTDNPALQAKLTQARSAGDIGTTLDLLGQIFDGMDAANAELNIVRESRPDEAFTAGDRAMLSSMLKTQFMREMSGSGVGEDLRRLFRRNELKLEVKDLGQLALMHYDPNGQIIRLNQRHVEEYIRGRGLTKNQLLTDDAALRPLMLSVLPSFVHEAVHFDQHVWANRDGVPVLYGQEMEVEAMGKEALFVLQKGRSDKTYVKFLADNAKGNKFAASSLALARSLQGDPDGFAQMVRIQYYPQTPSFRTNLAKFYEVGYTPTMLEHIEAEEKRRASLTPDQRAAINNSGFTFGGDDLSQATWVTDHIKLPDEALTQMKTGLTGLIEYQETNQDRVIDLNTAYNGRDQATDTYLTAGLRGLSDPSPKSDSLGTPEVPPVRRASTGIESIGSGNGGSAVESVRRVLDLFSPSDPLAHVHGGTRHSHAVSPKVPHVHPELR